MRLALRFLGRHRGPLAGFATLAAALLAPGIAGAEDRFSFDVRLARQAERFQSHEADSLGLSVTSSTVGIGECAFRVMDLPLQKGVRPSVTVFGRAMTSERVFVYGAGLPAAIARTEESPMVDVLGGLQLSLPLGMVDGTKGANLFLRYEGGVVIARSSGENFLQTSSVHFGFERDGGVFDGSEMEVGSGYNDLFGNDWGASRWSARMLVMMGLGAWPGSAAEATAAGKPAAKPNFDARRPVRLFAELELMTDGRPGPDALSVRAGVALDAGTLLTKIAGADAR